jgi:hypothetical protein
MKNRYMAREVYIIGSRAGFGIFGRATLIFKGYRKIEIGRRHIENEIKLFGKDTKYTGWLQDWLEVYRKGYIGVRERAQKATWIW